MRTGSAENRARVTRVLPVFMAAMLRQPGTGAYFTFTGNFTWARRCLSAVTYAAACACLSCFFVALRAAR
jgi:hypothetical protein